MIYFFRYVTITSTVGCEVCTFVNTIKLFDKTLQNQNQVHLCILYFVHPVYLCTFGISFYILYIILPWSFQIPLLGVLSDFWYVADPRKMANFKLDLFFNLVWGGASGETREGQPGVDISDVSRSPVMDNRMIWWYEKKFFLLLLSGDMWDRDKVQCPIIRWHLTLFTVSASNCSKMFGGLLLDRKCEKYQKIEISLYNVSQILELLENCTLYWGRRIWDI